MRKIIVKLFASSWYIFLTYIYDARSYLHQINSFLSTLSAHSRTVLNTNSYLEPDILQTVNEL